MSWIWVLAVLSTVAAEEFYLGPGETREIIFNDPISDVHTYKISVSPGYNVRILCDDFRLPYNSVDDPCKLGKVIFQDGENKIKIKCGKVEQPVNIRSTGNSMTMKLMLENGGRIFCVAKTSQDPKSELINLNPYEEAYVLDTTNEKHTPYFDKVWLAASPPGTRISAQCTVYTTKVTPCYQNVVLINAGDGYKEYCGDEKFEVMSMENKFLSIRIMSDKFGKIRARCILQAIITVKNSEGDEITSHEDDSTEHGVVIGKTSTSCKCGWRNTESGRIFHGRDTEEGEYPWMVGIRDEKLYQRCGGSIITPYHILTAAHCMFDAKIRNISEIINTIVSIGASNTQHDASHGQSQYIKVKETFIPIEYIKFEKRYDIAVLYLEKKIQYSQWVGPVCMPKAPYKLINRYIKITGWGLSDQGFYPQHLMQTKLKVLPKALCNVPEFIICHASKISSICYGDSGSPLVYLDPDTNRYTQVSVASYTIQTSCRSGSGSSNVSYHLNYIKDIIQKTMPSELCM